MKNNIKKFIIILSFLFIPNINGFADELDVSAYEVQLNKESKIAVLINSLGATPHEELFIISNKLNAIMKSKEIVIKKSYVGRYATSMEMAGLSITILKLDEEIEKFLLAPANCPFWY